MPVSLPENLNITDEDKTLLQEILGSYNMPGIGKVEVLLNEKGEIYCKDHPNLTPAEVMWEGKKI